AQGRGDAEPEVGGRRDVQNDAASGEFGGQFRVLDGPDAVPDPRRREVEDLTHRSRTGRLAGVRHEGQPTICATPTARAYGAVGLRPSAPDRPNPTTPRPAKRVATRAASSPRAVSYPR